MRRSILILAVLLPALAGCGTYVGTHQVAEQMGPAARVDEGASRATIIAGGHEVILQSGASIVFIDGNPVTLARPVRMVNGQLEIPVEIYAYLPRADGMPEADGITFPPPPKRETPTRVAPKYCRINTIVVDPGHGGTQDLGAVYAGVREKDITLDVGIKLAAALRRKGMTVALTRTSDVPVTLEQRSAAANAKGVDLFLSVHANAASNIDARGIEVFHLDRTFTHKGATYDDTSRARELNRNRLRDRDLSGTGLTPAPVTAADLAERRKASAELAREIERALVKQLGGENRGVKTARFAVLKWTACPAVLVEIGFLSNATDRARLTSPAWRAKVAEAIAEGVQRYREECEKPL